MTLNRNTSTEPAFSLTGAQASDSIPSTAAGSLCAHERRRDDSSRVKCVFHINLFIFNEKHH